jgi:hypothetical protein
MKVMAHLPIVCIWLALIGCQNTSTSEPEDAGQPSDAVSSQDAVTAGPDLLVSEDMVLLASPDLAVPDKPANLDTAPDKATINLADAAPDLAMPDKPANLDTTPDKIPDSARDLTPSPSDLASFCTGGASRMVVNGISSTPSVTGKVLTLEGSGGEFQITTATFDQPIVVSWQAEKSAFSGFKNVDLASPPSGWSVRISVGCTSTSAGCSNPADSFTSGLVGSLAVSMGKSAIYDMSICLHVEETESNLHPLVHSLDLFATHIEAN